MGEDAAGDPILLNRCPIVLITSPFAQAAKQAYSFWRKGITPNGRGSRGETALYCATMQELLYLEGEAEDWYIREKTPKE